MDIKNRAFYYCDDITNIDNISLQEKSCNNFLIHRVAYKTQAFAHFFEKVDRYFRQYDGTNYLE